MTPRKFSEDPGLWAILPEALAAHVEAEIRHVEARGEGALQAEIPFEYLSSTAGIKTGGDQVNAYYDAARRDYEMIGNIAVVRISGTLFKSMNGLNSYLYSAMALQAAAEDPRAAAVLAIVNSPGGTVAGVTDLVDAVREVAAQKPVYAYTDGTMASGAYWPLAGVRAIGAVSTAQVGSIGVLTAHEDISKMLDQFGVKLTFLTSGKYKALGNFAEPLSEEARGYIQERIDAIYTLFLADVAAGRSLSVDDAGTWADGRVFSAADAVQAGLVDRVGSLTQFFNFIREDITMKPDDVKAQHPDTHRAIFDAGKAEGKTEAQAGIDTARKTAASEAKEKQQAETVAMVTALFGQAAADKLAGVLQTGVTAEQLAAMKAAGLMSGNDAVADGTDAASRQAILDGITAATPNPVQSGGRADAQAATDEYTAKVEAAMGGGVTRPQAMKQVNKAHPDLARKWIASQQQN